MNPAFGNGLTMTPEGKCLRRLNAVAAIGCDQSETGPSIPVFTGVDLAKLGHWLPAEKRLLPSLSEQFANRRRAVDSGRTFSWEWDENAHRDQSVK